MIPTVCWARSTSRSPARRWESAGTRWPSPAVRTSSPGGRRTWGRRTASTRSPETRCAIPATVSLCAGVFVIQIGQSVRVVEDATHRTNINNNNWGAHVIAFRTLRLAHGNHTEAAAQQIVEVLHQHVGGIVQSGVHPVLGRRTERVQQEVAERDVGATVATDHILCAGDACARATRPIPRSRTDRLAH